MIVKSEKYPSLLVVGVVRFEDGVAEVDDPEKLAQLRKLTSLGVVVPDSEAPQSIPESPAGEEHIEPAPPADNEHVADGSELFEPKGNASLEEWQEYATQKGVPVDHLEGLKREEIKTLLSE